MMIIRMTAASLPGTSGRPLDIAALISWLLTASIGAYMLRTWIARGGLRRQRATGVGVPPPVVFGHAGAAIGGLVAWACFVGGACGRWPGSGSSWSAPPSRWASAR